MTDWITDAVTAVARTLDAFGVRGPSHDHDGCTTVYARQIVTAFAVGTYPEGELAADYAHTWQQQVPRHRALACAVAVVAAVAGARRAAA